MAVPPNGGRHGFITICEGWALLAFTRDSIAFRDYLPYRRRPPLSKISRERNCYCSIAPPIRAPERELQVLRCLDASCARDNDIAQTKTATIGYNCSHIYYVLSQYLG